jgi:phosphatidylserine/phosphatidylglycerophosphate/cardiolipin synthase-like enzyme
MSDFERKASSGAVSLKIYRGEGVGLLAFDLDQTAATDDFVGFTVEVKYPGSTNWGALHNRLHFAAAASPSRPHSSREAPFQKFRWIHVPGDVQTGEFRYRVTARYMRPDGSLVSGDSVENAISLAPETIEDVVNVGFTRGFASSQAYASRFGNEAGILPAPGAAAAASLAHDMSPFPKHYEWLGFETRRLVLALLQEVQDDDDLSLDALIYESKEPDILRRFEAIGSRLRAIIDDHGEQGHDDSAESVSAARLRTAGAAVKRMHLARQQHNKVLVVRRNGVPVKVLAGSTNFSLRGLYIQANNALVFQDQATAALFGRAFEAYWTLPAGAAKFRSNPLSKQWWETRNEPGSRFQFCFSPHTDDQLSLTPVAQAIENAESSVLYAMVFLSQLTGRVRDGLEELMQRSLFSYGVAQRTNGLTVQKPDGSKGLLPFAYLGSNAPEPFQREWSGNTTERSNMVHHKFLVTDFNGARPTVFTGSSNMAAGGEKDNGDHLIWIEDRKIAIAYAIEALRMFDHFHFRVRMRDASGTQEPITLAKPPAPGKKTWFASYYRASHIKERDRKLFAT